MKWTRIGSQEINGNTVGWQRRGNEYEVYCQHDGGRLSITAWSMQEAQRAYVALLEQIKNNFNN